MQTEKARLWLHWYIDSSDVVFAYIAYIHCTYIPLIIYILNIAETVCNSVKRRNPYIYFFTYTYTYYRGCLLSP